MSNSPFQRWNPKEIFSTGQDGEVCTIKYAFARSLVVFTDYGIVSAVPGKRIKVISYMVSEWNGVANGMFFLSKPAGAGAQIYPQISLAANTQEIQGLNIAGWFQTNTGESLTATTTLAGMDIQVGYIEVTP